MTLILSEVSKHGVVMVADSAITTTHTGVNLPSGKPIPKYVRFGAQKVIQVPNEPIGISFWGMGRIGEIPTDIWINDFLTSRIDATDNLEDICNKLADEVNNACFMAKQNCEGGFHVGSVIDIDSVNPTPILYHIHRGHPENTPSKFQLYKDHPDGQGITIKEYRDNLENGMRYFLRNGQYTVFAHLQQNLIDHIYALNRNYNIKLPYPENLQTLERLNRMMVGIMCDFYALSDQVASVARPISSLIIDLKGNVTYSSALSDVSYV
ncbi:MAG: hypothetical protein IPJ03_15155 [Ignavibacteriales bacterium]|nr:hypothetical protein [Ignavibacteriales bacterium]